MNHLPQSVRATLEQKSARIRELMAGMQIGQNLPEIVNVTNDDRSADELRTMLTHITERTLTRYNQFWFMQQAGII